MSGVTMAQVEEYNSGDLVPATGQYEQLNVLGRRTGMRRTLVEDQLFPPGPHGFTWTISEEPEAE